MGEQQARFLTRSRAALADEPLQRLLVDVTGRFGQKRAAAIAEVADWEAVRDRARTIKRAALADLATHLEAFERRLVDLGGSVHWASTPEDARQVVLAIAARRGARRVVKSKSMVSEEIHLNAALEAAGIRSLESDFGEYIIQLAGEPPSHIIAPAIHKSRDSVARLFERRLGLPYTDDVEVLTGEARRRLREEFWKADLGISGANFLVAQTGTVVIVENEGNARLSTSVPPVHIVVTGIEKVLPAIDDLDPFLALLPRSATGQSMTSYVSMITGPRRGGELDGPEELHVVLVDNGRSRMLADPVMREALHCIRCGACQIACPVYRSIGGHSYGGVYAGPIGAIVGSHLEPSRATPDLPFASSLCGACAEVCPVRIDIPRLLVHLRTAAMRGDLTPERPAGRLLQRLAMCGWAAVAARPRFYRWAGRWFRRLLRLPAVRRLPGPLRRWTEVRELGPVPALSFLELWEREREAEP